MRDLMFNWNCIWITQFWLNLRNRLSPFALLIINLFFFHIPWTKKIKCYFKSKKIISAQTPAKDSSSKLSQRYEINLFLFCSFNATTNLKNRIVCPATWFRTGGCLVFLKANGKWLSYSLELLQNSISNGSVFLEVNFKLRKLGGRSGNENVASIAREYKGVCAPRSLGHWILADVERSIF